MRLGRGPKRSKEILMDMYELVIEDGNTLGMKESMKESITIEDNNITAITAEKLTIGKGFKTLIEGIPPDWGWLRLKVHEDIRKRFDNLTDSQKIALYIMMDKSIKTWNGELEKGPIIKLSEGRMTKFITLKISSEAIARWQKMPTIKKSNTFSRTSWAINNVVLPFFCVL